MEMSELAPLMMVGDGKRFAINLIRHGNQLTNPMDKEVAELIVRAVNAHDELVKACRLALLAIETCPEQESVMRKAAAFVAIDTALYRLKTANGGA